MRERSKCRRLEAAPSGLLSCERTGCRGTVLVDSCFIHNGSRGHYWEIGSDGQYEEIEARVGTNDNNDHDILQISSVLLL
jgi:hypothetical protein